MITVKSAIPTQYTITATKRVSMLIVVVTICATALPTPASENTRPSIPSICGNTTAQPSASIKRRDSFVAWTGESRVIKQASTTATTQPTPNATKVTFFGSSSG